MGQGYLRRTGEVFIGLGVSVGKEGRTGQTYKDRTS
jgi:hypothetical protein